MCSLRRTLIAAVPIILLGGSTAVAQDTIKIGGIAPLSPPGGVETGLSLRSGMEVAVEELNAAGGLLGKKVELVVEDTSGVPDKGAAAFERLASKDKVVAVTGEGHSAVCIAVQPVAQKYNIPFIADECWADAVTGNQIPQVFRITEANSLVYASAAEWVVKAGFKNVAIIGENSDWGLGVIDVFRSNLEKAGVTVTSFTAERTVSDFTPQLLQLKGMSPRPDLLIAGFTGPGMLQMLRQAYDLKLGPSKETAVFTAGADALEPEFWKVMGDDGVGIMSNPAGLPGKPDTELSRKFSKAYQEHANRPVNSVAMEGYDGVMVVAEAIKAAGTTEPDALMEALRKVKWEGTRGTIYFSQDKEPAWMFQQWPEPPNYIIQYTAPNQEPKDAAILWPAVDATVDGFVIRQ